MNSIQWKGESVYIHHISYRVLDNECEPVVSYALASRSMQRIGLFKVKVEDLELNGKKLETYLLGQVERNG
jgi:hypothetical protein